MKNDNPNREAAELLNEYWDESDFSHNEKAIYNSTNVEILGTSMALGNGPAMHLIEEGGLVMMKAMHSSDLGRSWEHNESGYRTWFRYVEQEERTRTITEEVYTF